MERYTTNPNINHPAVLRGGLIMFTAASALLFSGCTSGSLASMHSNEAPATTEVAGSSNTYVVDPDALAFDALISSMSPLDTSPPNVLFPGPKKPLIIETTQPAPTTTEQAVPEEEPTPTPIEVLPAIPRHVSIPAVGIDTYMREVGSTTKEINGQQVLVVDLPKGTKENREPVYWLNELEKSKMPSTLGEGPVLFYVHACVGIPECAGNNINDNTLQVGAEMQVVTDNGELTYALAHPVLNLPQTAEGVGKSEELKQLLTPNSLVLFACAYNDGGTVSKDNWVAVFEPKK